MSVLRAIAFLLAVCVAACARTPDAQAIRESIENAAAAAQSHDAAALTDVLADDFIGNDEFDKAALKSRLRGQFVIADDSGAVAQVAALYPLGRLSQLLYGVGD